MIQFVFFAHTIDRKPVRSKVIKKRLSFDNLENVESKGSIEALTVALIRMSEEVRRTLHTQTQYSDKQLKTIEKLSERNIMNEENRLELEREVMLKSIIMEMNEEEQGNETKQQGMELLGKAFDVYKSSQESTIKQKIKETIMQDDDILNEFMKDDEIKSRIWDSFHESKRGGIMKKQYPQFKSKLWNDEQWRYIRMYEKRDLFDRKKNNWLRYFI